MPKRGLRGAHCARCSDHALTALAALASLAQYSQSSPIVPCTHIFIPAMPLICSSPPMSMLPSELMPLMLLMSWPLEAVAAAASAEEVPCMCPSWAVAPRAKIRPRRAVRRSVRANVLCVDIFCICPKGVLVFYISSRAVVHGPSCKCRAEVSRLVESEWCRLSVFEPCRFSK